MFHVCYHCGEYHADKTIDSAGPPRSIQNAAIGTRFCNYRSSLLVAPAGREKRSYSVKLSANSPGGHIHDFRGNRNRTNHGMDSL